MNQKTLLPSTITNTKAFIKWIVYRLGWHLHHHVWVGCGNHLIYVVCLKYHRRHPRNGENDQGAPGESGSCSHMVGRSRSTTQVRQMCISVVYSEIPWLQDDGTRSPTNGGWSQSSANAPAPQDVSQLKSIIGLISYYVWQIVLKLFSFPGLCPDLLWRSGNEVRPSQDRSVQWY